MIDAEVSLRSLLYITEALEQLIGQNGAKAVLRTAGQSAAFNLIEMLPLNKPEVEAIQSIGPIMIDLGFFGDMKIISPDKLQISDNQVVNELSAMGLQSIQSGRHYVIGLFEGFLKRLSGSQRKVTSIESDQNGEIWNLG